MEIEELILREFALIVDKHILSTLDNNHNPIYAQLSARLKLPQSKIREVIRKMQPRVLTKPYRQVLLINIY